jgi:tetratricopeptide (TPR) repeat protein
MRFLPRKSKLPAALDRRSRSALALFDAGQYASAERAWHMLLADCERELGPDHPGTIITLDHLGSALFRQRRFLESADQHREAHRRAVAAIGQNHPDTLTYAHNLGAALAVAHQWDEGLSILRDTLERRQRKLGHAHAETLDTAKTLGVSMFMLGDAQAAVDILQPAYRTAVQTFGPNDPLVEDIANNLNIVLRNSRRI